MRDRGAYLAAAGGRILNIPVPHTGQTPFSAGRPLAILTCWAFEIFRFAYTSRSNLHLRPSCSLPLPLSVASPVRGPGGEREAGSPKPTKKGMLTGGEPTVL